MLKPEREGLELGIHARACESGERGHTPADVFDARGHSPVAAFQEQRTAAACAETVLALLRRASPSRSGWPTVASRAAALGLVTCALLGCSSSPDPDARPPSTTPLTAESDAPAPPPTLAKAVSAATLVPLPPDLDARIEAAQRALLDGKYQDAGALVELARLQLLRDGSVADSDGHDDAARAKKNASRAVAVDDAAVAPRVVLTLALARSFEGSAGSLDLVDLAASSVPNGSSRAGAAALVVRGTVALARGDRKGAKTRGR